MGKRVPYIKLVCPTCSKTFERVPASVKNKQVVYCSRPCYHAGRTQRMLDRTYKSGHITDEQLLNDLRLLTENLGHLPSTIEVNKAWSNRSIKYARRFGSLKNALGVLGLLDDLRFAVIPPAPKTAKRTRRGTVSKRPGRKPPNRYTPEQLISEIQRVAGLLGHTPSDPEFRRHGRCSASAVWAAFGKWKHACEVAGLKPNDNHQGGPHRVPRYKYKRKDGVTARLNGSYEVRFVKVLDRLKLDWQSHGDYSPLQWTDADGKTHRYMPDFYVPAWNLYIETKGWYQEKDKIKMQCVARDNPGLTVIVVGKDALAQFERTKRLPLL